MKTALQTLKSECTETVNSGAASTAYRNAMQDIVNRINQLLPVEQDQIESAFLTGCTEWTGINSLDIPASKDYYIDNFITPNIENPSA